MTDDVLILANRLASLETELMVLRTELSRLLRPKPTTKAPTFASLEGVWGGQGNFDLGEIRAAEIQVPEILT